MKFSMLLLIVLLTGLTGCTNQQWYQGMQEAGRQQNCRTIIDEAEKQKCEDGYKKTYEEYKKEREEVTKS